MTAARQHSQAELSAVFNELDELFKLFFIKKNTLMVFWMAFTKKLYRDAHAFSEQDVDSLYTKLSQTLLKQASVASVALEEKEVQLFIQSLDISANSKEKFQEAASQYIAVLKYIEEMTLSAVTIPEFKAAETKSSPEDELTPLLAAFFERCDDDVVTRLLEEKNLDVAAAATVTDLFGQNILHFMIDAGSPLISENGVHTFMQNLDVDTRYNLTVQEENVGGLTPLDFITPAEHKAKRAIILSYLDPIFAAKEKQKESRRASISPRQNFSLFITDFVAASAQSPKPAEAPQETSTPTNGRR